MTTTKTIFAASRMAVLAAAVTSATLLGACAPLLIGGAMVGTALSVTDRRTSGAQLEDQAIELKAINRVREAAGGAANVTFGIIAGEISTRTYLTSGASETFDQDVQRKAAFEIQKILSDEQPFTYVVFKTGSYVVSKKVKDAKFIPYGGPYDMAFWTVSK